MRRSTGQYIIIKFNPNQFWFRFVLTSYVVDSLVGGMIPLHMGDKTFFFKPFSWNTMITPCVVIMAPSSEGCSHYTITHTLNAWYCMKVSALTNTIAITTAKPFSLILHHIYFVMVFLIYPPPTPGVCIGLGHCWGSDFFSCDDGSGYSIGLIF